MRLRNKLCLILLTCLSVSCSSSSKKGDVGVTVPQVLIGPIRMRRPSAPPIKPSETPGSDRYARSSEVDDQLECEPIKKILKKEQIKKLYECFKQQKDPLKLQFQLLRHTEPEWVLQVEEETPDCFVENASFLPVPREVFFLADDHSSITCINSRIDIEKDDSMDSVWSETETKMNVYLLKEELPKTEDETQRLIHAWILSPFFGKDKSLHGKTVPKKMCQACFQDENVFKTRPHELPKWP